MMEDRKRSLIALAAIAVAVVVAVCGVLLARQRPASLDARVTSVAATLRCPTCEAQSVADSHSTMAQSMRHEIRQQLVRGRSPDQIRSWFESRYGERVLLMPHPRGLALALWVVPVAAVVGGVGLLAWGRRRRTRSDTEAAGTVLSPRRVGVAALACVLVGAAVPAYAWARSAPARSASTAASRPLRAQDWVAVAESLDKQQDYRAAVQAYRHALRQRPGAVGVRTGLAFDLVRSGQPGQAIGLVAPLAHREGPHRALALLILGLAQRSAHLPSSTQTLREFLRVAPHHPAAAQVRRLLAESR